MLTLDRSRLTKPNAATAPTAGQSSIYGELDFDGTTLFEGNLWELFVFKKCSFRGTHFRLSAFQNCHFEHCDFSGAEFDEAFLYRSRLWDCSFDDTSCLHAEFTQCDMRSDTFLRADLTGASFDKTALLNSAFVARTQTVTGGRPYSHVPGTEAKGDQTTLKGALIGGTIAPATMRQTRPSLAAPSAQHVTGQMAGPPSPSAPIRVHRARRVTLELPIVPAASAKAPPRYSPIELKALNSDGRTQCAECNTKLKNCGTIVAIWFCPKCEDK